MTLARLWPGFFCRHGTSLLINAFEPLLRAARQARLGNPEVPGGGQARICRNACRWASGIFSIAYRSIVRGI